VNTYGQRMLNQEGCMARQGVDPISRKMFIMEGYQKAVL
jgi:hypothetical protein